MAVVTTAKKAVRRIGLIVNRSENKAAIRAYKGTLRVARQSVNAVTPFQLGWGASLQAVRWLDDSTLQIEGWAFERGNDYVEQPPTTTLSFVERGRRSSPVTANLQIVASQQVNRRSKDPRFDYSPTAFVATVDVAELAAQAVGRSAEFQGVLEVEGGGVKRRGWFKSLAWGGSAGNVPGRSVSGTWVSTSWKPRRGLVIKVGLPKVGVRTVSSQNRSVDIELTCRGVSLVSAWLESEAGTIPLKTEQIAGGVRVTGVLPSLDVLWDEAKSVPGSDGGGDAYPRVPKFVHHLRVADSKGREHLPILEVGEEPSASSSPSMFAYAGSDGGLLLSDAELSAIVTESTLELEPTPRWQLRGVLCGQAAGVQIALAGRRQEISADPEVDDNGCFAVTIPLLASRWGSPPLAPMAGRYNIVGKASDGRRFPVRGSVAVAAATPTESLSEWFRLTEGIGRDRHLVLQVAAPLADDELGTYNQTKLERTYNKRSFTASDSVYLESFYGRQATCNPLALDRVLAEQHPEMARFWGVVDRSVWTPDGATPVVEGTRAWWEARGSARYVIANDWLRRKFTHQPHQVVLQTWHGSMLKRIGLDRPSAGKSTQESLRIEKAKWDLLVSQNRHSTEIFKTAYEWTTGIVEEGYPRNDLMVTGDRAAIRRALGIGDDQVAVLYAPTWRDNTAGLVTFLDLETLSRDLGENYLILLRGHSRIMGQSSSVEVPGVLDVTTYPNVTELFLASDAMVTDYSSVMFDFSVTGRPMIFFVPDMDDYRDSVRGVYFDLSEVAPGPVVATQDEVRDAILSMTNDAPRYQAAYLAWQKKFNALDDGGSAQRVMDRLLSTPPRGDRK